MTYSHEKTPGSGISENHRLSFVDRNIVQSFIAKALYCSISGVCGSRSTLSSSASVPAQSSSTRARCNVQPIKLLWLRFCGLRPLSSGLCSMSAGCMFQTSYPFTNSGGRIFKYLCNVTKLPPGTFA